MARFELSGVRVRIGARTVLDGLSLTVERGEVFALVGPNGSGKTTAVRVAVGLLAPEAGTARIGGRPAGPGSRAAVGVAFQDVALYRHLTVRENLTFFARLYGAGRREAAAVAADAEARLGLGPYAGTRVEALSGGWRRRVHIAAAVVHRPAAVAMDEPDAGLDPPGKEALAALLSGLAERGAGVLVTVHDLALAERLATRVGLLHRGRLAAVGTVRELLARVGARMVAEVAAADLETLRRRARDLGWGFRPRGKGAAVLLLPLRLELPEAARELEGVPLCSLALREVRLEDVVAEVTHGTGGAAAAA